jgi:hypothetical protein
LFDHHYLYTENPTVQALGKAMGCKIIDAANPVTGMGSLQMDAYCHMALHVLKDLDMLDPDAPLPGNAHQFLVFRPGIFLHASLAMFMLRPATYRRMHQLAMEGKAIVQPARKVPAHERIALCTEGETTFPLLHSTTQANFPKKFKPTISISIPGNTLMNRSAQVQSRPATFTHYVDEVELSPPRQAWEVKGLEAYLEQHPNHFGWTEAD